MNDGRVGSYPDEVLITIRNVPPTADAGADQVVDAGTQVVLDGTATRDANGDPIGFSWTQIEGPSVPLQGADQEKASFLPEISGVYRFQLVAFDGQLYSPPDDVQVVVNDLNRVPTADAGEDQTVLVGSTVSLDGSGSTDPEEDPLDYLWSQVEGPEPVVLEGASTSNAWFTPTQVGAYRFQLVVNDGTDSSPPDDVTVTAVSENSAPVAVTSGVSSVEIGDPVTLDGTASYDPDGDPLAFQWAQTGGVQVMLEDADTAVATFHAVSEGVFRFDLVVSDGELVSDPATFEVTVNGSNQVPIADAGRLIKGLPGKEICLDGSASYDPDWGDSITYSWSQVEGPLVTLHDPDTATPCFTPSNTGKYVFELRVSDGQTQSAPDQANGPGEREPKADQEIVQERKHNRFKCLCIQEQPPPPCRRIRFSSRFVQDAATPIKWKTFSCSGKMFLRISLISLRMYPVSIDISIYYNYIFLIDGLLGT